MTEKATTTETTTAAAEVAADLKPISNHITELGEKIMAHVKEKYPDGYKDGTVETTGVFSSNLPEGVDEKQAKAVFSYISTFQNANDYAVSKLGLEHLKANPDAGSFTLKSRIFGKDHVTSKYSKGTGSDDAGNIQTDMQLYHTGTNMGQRNLIIKHSNAAAREALKFD